MTRLLNVLFEARIQNEAFKLLCLDDEIEAKKG
jgi:hypothetical protein